jgi:hypothetical protein
MKELAKEVTTWQRSLQQAGVCRAHAPIAHTMLSPPEPTQRQAMHYSLPQQ